MTRPRSRFAGLVFTLAVCGASLSGQDKAADLDAAIAALVEADAHFGYGVAVAGLDGPIDVRVAGKLDEETEFERWHLVPLGTCTTLLLEDAMHAAIASKKLDWDLAVVAAGTPNAIDLGTVWFDGRCRLPGYRRYLASGRDARPLAAVLESHAFRLDDGTFPLCDKAMLRHAIAQGALEQALERPWSELMRDAARRLSMASPMDLTRAWPARVVACGHRADGRPWPVRVAEVAAYSNTACPIDDIVQLGRTCLRDVLAVHDKADPRALGPARLFVDDEDFTFDVRTRRLRSTELGCTLEIRLIPEARKVLVVFGSRMPGAWEETLWLPATAFALQIDGSRILIDEMSAEQEVSDAEIEQTIVGTYHGSVEVGARRMELDVVAAGNTAKVRLRDMTAADAPSMETEVALSGTYLLGEIQAETALDERPGVSYRFCLAVDLEHRGQLNGTIYRAVTTTDRIELECLPYHVRVKRET